MRHSIFTVVLGLALFSGMAFAADPVKPAAAPAALASAPAAEKTPQQNKMATCNKSAEGKKGDERKAFMKDCLSAKKETQQSKMKTCNAEATGKKGDERKAFMSECLKK
jgi:psiF repeat